MKPQFCNTSALFLMELELNLLIHLLGTGDSCGSQVSATSISPPW